MKKIYQNIHINFKLFDNLLSFAHILVAFFSHLKMVKPLLFWQTVLKRPNATLLQNVVVWFSEFHKCSNQATLFGIPKKLILLEWKNRIYDNMRPSTIRMYGSKPMIYDISCQVVFNKCTIYDVPYMRLYAACCCFLQKIGRDAGV